MKRRRTRRPPRSRWFWIIALALVLQVPIFVGFLNLIQSEGPARLSPLRMHLVGYTPDAYSLSGKHFAQNELEVIGTRCGRRRDLDQAAQLLAQGKVRSIVTERYPLSDVNAAHQRLQSGEVLGRLVLDVAQNAPSTTA